MSEHWVYAAIGLLLVLHVVVLVRAYRKAGEGSRQREEYRTPHGIECPNCGSANGEEYRYCRRCVTELPGQLSLLDQQTQPQERRTM